jgi:hypothetical protein
MSMILLIEFVNANREKFAGDPETTQSFSVIRSSSQVDETLSLTKLNCWIDIKPGSTTSDQALLLLETRYGKDNITLDQDRISWQTQHPQDRCQSGWLDIDKQGIVDEITLTFSQNKLTVAQLISEIGEPSFVYVSTYPSTCAGSLISYPSIGINAWLHPENGSIGVQSGQSISSVKLLAIEQARMWSITDHSKLKWQGFLDYCILVDKSPVS